MLCVVRERSLRPAYPSSRGVLPRDRERDSESVCVCVCVCVCVWGVCVCVCVCVCGVCVCVCVCVYILSVATVNLWTYNEQVEWRRTKNARRKTELAKFCVGFAECFFVTVLVCNYNYVNYLQCYKKIMYIIIYLHKNVYIYHLSMNCYFTHLWSFRLPEDGPIQWPKHVAAVNNKHCEGFDVCPYSVH